MPRVTVGVDVGKDSHQAAGYDPAGNRVVGRVTFPVSRAGFERFRLLLERLAPESGDVLIGLEARGVPGRARLRGGAHQPVSGGPVPPLAGRQGED